MRPAVEEFLQKFEVMAPASDWQLRGGSIREKNDLDTGEHHCPLSFMSGLLPCSTSGKSVGLSRREAMAVINAADFDTGGLGVEKEIRRRLLAACGLSK
jgi:hypothetical protein